MTFPRFKLRKAEGQVATTATLATIPVFSPSVPGSVATVATVAGIARQNAFLEKPAPASAVNLVAFHERAAIVEYDGDLPRKEADRAAARDLGYGTAEALYSAAIEAWRSEITAIPQTGNHDIDKLATGSLQFLASDWATKALAADWDENALFAIHEGQSPKERIDTWGLIPVLAWSTHRCTIESFSRDECKLRTQRAWTLHQPRMRANFDEGAPWWRHSAINQERAG